MKLGPSTGDATVKDLVGQVQRVIQDICHNWLRFEGEYGTLEDFDHAAQKVTPRLEELQLFRLQQEAKSVPELIDQKEKSHKKSVNGKRKTDSNMNDKQSPAKQQKNTPKTQTKCMGKKRYEHIT
ncbi:uncharacterized protein LOC116122323 [Pistacia vera]|uniref:uncharacterized protein LOC116122323 n=1 Tax=Pistacia vera TaxID=55513 RepID=UPI001262C070|nr:uncharacterized protein LOC116122323 [Pistacia vera]